MSEGTEGTPGTLGTTGTTIRHPDGRVGGLYWALMQPAGRAGTRPRTRP